MPCLGEPGIQSSRHWKDGKNGRPPGVGQPRIACPWDPAVLRSAHGQRPFPAGPAQPDVPGEAILASRPVLEGPKAPRLTSPP